MKRLLVGLALAVVSLAQGALAECITLSWTSPGDDNYTGQASFYDIRYSKAFITEENWLGSTRVTHLPTPRTAGTVEQFTVCGLEPQQAYFFAIKAGDEKFNWGQISNVVLRFTAGELSPRGDVNLNTISYEVGDAVIFTNFFLYGSSVFIEDLAQQIANSDVTADGIPLQVSDLTYLIRVVVGDAPPLLRLNPYADDLRVLTENNEDGVRVTTDAIGTIGSAYFEWELDRDVRILDVATAAGSDGMNVGYRVDNDRLRVIMYDIGKDKVAEGRNDVLQIDYSGSGTIHLTETEITDYDGRPYDATVSQKQLPAGFELSQNYPNPFNPTTNIDFYLPQPSDISLDVYNVLGERVTILAAGQFETGSHRVEWDGTDHNGHSVSSGVYFYRLVTDGEKLTRKMLLLK